VRRGLIFFGCLLLGSLVGWAQETQDVAAVTAQVDKLFTQWQEGVPAPATLSEANGVCMSSPHGGLTYSQLAGLAHRELYTLGPNAIPGLVRWAQAPEAYLRQIAISALMPLTGQSDHNRVVGKMHTFGDINYTQIMNAVWRYAREHDIPLDAEAMPMVMLPKDGQIDSRVFGEWRAVNANSPSVNIFDTYTIESNRFVVSSWDNARGRGPDRIKNTYIYPVARYEDLGGGWVGVHVTGDRLEITPPRPGQPEPLVGRHKMDERLRDAFRLTAPDTLWIAGDHYERIGTPNGDAE
jgi:hypothetical protein